MRGAAVAEQDQLLATPDRDRVGRWCLPAPRPWEGLPSASAFLRTHPLPPPALPGYEREFDATPGVTRPMSSL